MAQDPDAIERDIERSRERLAQTVDAIADRVSPRRVADRGKANAAAALSSLRSRVGSLGSAPPGTGSGPGTVPAAPAGPVERVGELAGKVRPLVSAGGEQVKALVRRKDPAAVAAAVGALTVLALLLRRRRR